MLRQRRPGRLDDLGSATMHDVELSRVAWLTTVVLCLVAVVALLFSGYLGYASVVFAVALSAAINLR